MTSIQLESPTLTKKDFASDQEVRWCPGCGDYSILAQMQKIMPELGIPRENIVFISGIGCSSRFPYYMNTYGIHSIHGRAPTLASGLAATNPDLSIWVITGDGDGLSIGGNHLIHSLRRNMDINIILFNNRIYGLTKGQYSPTSRPGTRTKSSPMGSIDRPLEPIALAMGAEASFVARTIDNDPKHLADTLSRAATHKGTSFVEVYQNCVIFNPGEWTNYQNRKTRNDHMLFLEHGQPMIFGAGKDKGIVLRGLELEVVSLDEGYSEDDLLVHDAYSSSPTLAFALSHLLDPAPFGIFREDQRPTYAEELLEQVEIAKAKRGKADLQSLYSDSDLWHVE